MKEEKEGVEIQTEVTVFDVDVHHFFAETLSKGKKTDHAMHNVCLDHLIEMYRASFQQRFGTDVLRHVVVWTDNAPTQYSCRQIFIKVASVEERHPGVKLTHCLAVVDNFKGYHDAIGKDPARLVKALELMGIRSPNALGVFKNCTEHLQKTHGQTKWKQCEVDKDARLKKKGRFGMDSRTVWFVAETREEQDKLLVEHPGKILLCDRSFILDTRGHQAVDNTTQLHEFRSVAEQVPEKHPRKWPAHTAKLPCKCVLCHQDPTNNKCVYACWRAPAEMKIGIHCPHTDEARKWVGVRVVHERTVDKVKQKKEGTVVAFLPSECKWEIDMDGGSTEKLSYTQLCRGMDRFDKKSKK